MDTLDLLKIRENRDMLRLLRRQVQSSPGIIPFVGAGMSVSLGFPTWTNFLLAQADLAGVKDDVAALLDNGKYEEAAEALRAARGDLRFNDTLTAQFDRDLVGSDASKAAIGRLPFLASGPVVTTNFDRAIEHVFNTASRPFNRIILGRRVDDALSQLVRNGRLLIKLHGECVFPQGRVLTLSEYVDAYGHADAEVDLSLPLPNLLKFVLQSRPMLFLGCSLARDRTMRVVSAVAQGVGIVEHYAIVGAPSDAAAFHARDKFLADLGIRPIWYPDGQHDSIVALLDHLLASQSGSSGDHQEANAAQRKRSAAIDQLNADLAHAGCDASSLELNQVELLRRSRHSRIYRTFSASGEERIIKFTNSDAASLAALRQITGQSVEFNQHDLQTTVTLPTWAGTTGSEVVEILPRREGVSLELVRLRSPSAFKGDILAEIFNDLVKSAHALHSVGVLHRDITPSNILLSAVDQQVRVSLVDVSFACQVAGAKQVPTSSGAYTAPEQAAGAAVSTSDYYSIAATCFFLVTGSPPNIHDHKSIEVGLAAMDFGYYDARSIMYDSDVKLPLDDTEYGWMSRALFRLLLSPDPTARPSRHWSLLLSDSSKAVRECPIVGILDLADYGIVIIDEGGSFEVVTPDAEARTLPKLLRLTEDPKLKAFLQQRQPNVLR